jgi:integrase
MSITADVLVGRWPDQWPRPDAVTNENYSQMVQRFGREFRGRDVDGISKAAFRDWANENPGAARYVRTMLNDALEDGLIKSNGLKGVKLGRSQGRKEVEIPTREQVDLLARSAPSAEFGDAILFAAYTGLRQGEHRALRSEDFLPAFRVYVEFQLDRHERLKAPKGKKGRRLLMVPSEVRDIYGKVRSADVAGELVRPWPFKLWKWKEQWKLTRKKAGLWPQWHELRHFCATWLLDNGASAEDVAVQFGHNDGGQLIRELYGHPDRDLALGRLEALVS